MRRRKTCTHSKAVHAAGHPDLFWGRPRALTSGMQRCVLVFGGRDIVQDRNYSWFVGNFPSTGNLSSCFFYSGGVNFLMQLQFLAPVELFFKQLKGYSF